jgi:general L-amino acid transport system permease protein
VALFAALVTYTAGFVAEVVRGGILAVGKGQKEAASSLGLTPGQRLRLIVIPQALRVMVPPMTSQYLNLLKNSSFGAAIAYPEIVSVFMGSALNATGQAIEIIAITLAIYLSIGLAVSAFMNWYNARIALVTR